MGYNVVYGGVDSQWCSVVWYIVVQGGVVQLVIQCGKRCTWWCGQSGVQCGTRVCGTEWCSVVIGCCGQSVVWYRVVYG